MEQKTVLVLGATGQQGYTACQKLSMSGKFKIKGVVRDLSNPRCKELQSLGVQIVQLDLKTDQEKLKQALKGVYGLFSVFNPWKLGDLKEETEIAIKIHKIAAEQGVQHIVYSSVTCADSTDIPHFKSKAPVERNLKELGVGWTILRPVFFNENLLGPGVIKSINNGIRVLSLPVPQNTKLQLIAVEDIGAFAALSLMDPGKFNKKTLEIAGDELTLEEMAKILGCRYEAKDINSVEDPDMKMMFKWFVEGPGMQANIPELKKLYPQLMDFKTWVAKHNLASSAP